mmetsp:Transcript_7676/g.20451  ORF Transcript_7676/g.20451 Transcript_7676/m.20451 type:complete len:145 (+) Transcript_7676:1357-1791(+)
MVKHGCMLCLGFHVCVCALNPVCELAGLPDTAPLHTICCLRPQWCPPHLTLMLPTHAFAAHAPPTLHPSSLITRLPILSLNAFDWMDPHVSTPFIYIATLCFFDQAPSSLVIKLHVGPFLCGPCCLLHASAMTLVLYSGGDWAS